MSKKRIATASLSLALSFGLVSLAGAQGSEPTYFMSAKHTVKPEMMEAFRQFVIGEWNPTAKKGGLKVRHFWTQRLGETNVVYMGTPIDLEGLDEPSFVRRALGDEAKYDAFRKKLASFIESTERSILEVQNDFTYIPDPANPMTVGELYLYEVESGKESVAEASWKRNLEAAKQSGHGRWIARRVFGGPVREVVSLTLYSSFADLAKGRPVARAFGQAEADETLQNMRPVLTNVRRYVLQYDTEASFNLEATSSQ